MIKWTAVNNPNTHFFVSSASRWQMGTDLEALIATMKRDKRPFMVWFVPTPSDAEYAIQHFAPQVDGAQHLATWSMPE